MAYAIQLLLRLLDNVLGRAEINFNTLYFRFREILDISCPASIDEVIVTFFEGVSVFGAPEKNITESYLVVFAPGSDLIVNYTGQYAPELLDATAGSIPDPAIICALTAQRCTGEYYPYADNDECLRLFASLPDSCPATCYDCWEKNAPYQGDTRLCRTLHLLSATLRPAVHCPHVKDVSEKCFVDQCPSGVRTTTSANEEGSVNSTEPTTAPTSSASDEGITKTANPSSAPTSTAVRFAATKVALLGSACVALFW
jgi:hypothetical protein